MEAEQPTEPLATPEAEPTLPSPSEGIKTGEPPVAPPPDYPDRRAYAPPRRPGPKRWQLVIRDTSPPLIRDYDLVDWAFRIVFLLIGLGLGFVIWHGV